MTEEEARGWLEARYTGGQIAKLESFATLLQAEAERQNLIARSTIDHIWSRHIVDSAQLLSHAPELGAWLDVGTGGGLPGMIVAILRHEPITLCDPRRKRTDFLQAAASSLRLSNVTVFSGNVQQLAGCFAVVSARAVSSIEQLLRWTDAAVSRETTYLLQRGQNWREDVALTRRAWQGVFHVEQSVTNSDAAVVIARDVRPR